MNSSEAIAIVEDQQLIEQPQAPLSAMPVMGVAQAVERHKMFQELVSKLLVPEVDYGTIPGTQQKSLLKPGAEKLCVFFGLQPNLMLQESKEDWEKGFFYYRYRLDLWRGSVRVASCEGSANSLEKKYRYTWAETDKKPSKEEANRLKARGLGRWRKVSNEWVWQERVENPNPFDLVNTLKKMAQKRAYVGATLMATSATGFFAHFDGGDGDGDDDPGEELIANGRTHAAESGPSAADRRPSAQPVEKSAEEQAIDKALLEYCKKEKGDRNAPTFFKARYGDKSLEQKRAILAGLTPSAPAAAAQHAPEVIEAEILEEPVAEDEEARLAAMEAEHRAVEEELKAFLLAQGKTESDWRAVYQENDLADKTVNWKKGMLEYWKKKSAEKHGAAKPEEPAAKPSDPDQRPLTADHHALKGLIKQLLDGGMTQKQIDDHIARICVGEYLIERLNPGEAAKAVSSLQRLLDEKSQKKGASHGK